MRSFKGLGSWLVIVSIVLLGLAGPPAAGAFTEKDLVVMSSVVGGVGFQYTTGVAAVVPKIDKDIRLTLEATSGYIDNAKRMYAGFGDMGIVAHDTARQAISHQEFFATKGREIRALAPIHKLQWHILVNADSPIKTIWDLKGKRVNLQPKGSSSEKTGTAIFAALGIDIQPSYYRHSEAAQAMKSGSIEAHFLGGITPVFMEYGMRTPLRVIALSDDDVAKITEKLPYLSVDQLPAGRSYKGTPETVQSVATWAILMCRADLSEDLAYALTKGVHEMKDLIVKSAKGAEVIDPANVKYLTVTLHPGAVKYYREAGAEIPDKILP